MSRATKRIVLLFFLLWLVSAAGGAQAAKKVSFMLDWYPNPDHVPFYVAKAEGYFSRQGLEVDIIVPADPSDPLKLVAVGKCDFAVSYQPSVIMAAAQGLPVVSIGALIQHPLSTILFLESSGFKRPADFRGKRIGYSVAPLYPVFFAAVAQNAGLTPRDYKLYHVGFNLVAPLLTGQVDAVIGAFRNYEAIQVELEGKKVGIFPLEKNGIPDFYELVLITNAKTLQHDPETVKEFLRAVTQGIDQTVAQPKTSLASFLRANPDCDNTLNRRSFAATLPFFKGSPAQDPARWQALERFMVQRGLVTTSIPVKTLVWPAAEPEKK
jgi:putative hydroxymethylpyrimidine transport system substrate-binding protein